MQISFDLCLRRTSNVAPAVLVRLSFAIEAWRVKCRTCGEPWQSASLLLELSTCLFLRLCELAQIRRRLVLADRHQHAIAAHEISVLADRDHRVAHAFGAARFAPTRTRVRIVYVFLVHRPGPRQRVVDGCDHVVENCRIGFVAINAFLEDRATVEVKRQAGGVIGAGSLERAARFHSRTS